MAEFSPRSYLRDTHGPRPIDTGASRDKRGAGRYGREPEEKTNSKSKRSSDKKTRSKHESTSRYKSSKSHSTIQSERPVFRLDVIQQPSRIVSLGLEVSTSVLVSLSYPCPESVPRDIALDTNRLVGVTSLVAETSAGDRVPMEADTMVAQRLVESLRPIPAEFVERMAETQPCRLPLGYLTFHDLLIRQSGYYRVRISLLQMPSAGSCSQSPSTISAIDSDLVRVERRQTMSHYRRQQRAYI